MLIGHKKYYITIESIVELLLERLADARVGTMSWTLSESTLLRDDGRDFTFATDN